MGFHRLHNRRSKIANSELDHFQKQFVLALEEVMQAPRIDACLPHNRRHAGGMEALLVRELEGGAQNAFFGFQLWLSDRSTDVKAPEAPLP